MNTTRKPVRGFSQAFLYSPRAFAELSPGGDMPLTHVLWASLPTKVIRQLRHPSKPSAIQLRFALTSRGTVCAALVIQADTLQAAFIVPLLTDKAQQWLFDATENRGEFVCAFHRAGTKAMEVVRLSLAVNA